MISLLSPAQVERGTAALIDVREYPEYADASIPGSVLVPLSTIENRAQSWKKGDQLVLVCRSGRRASDAAQRLQNMGFLEIAVLEGGMEAWQQAGLPVRAAERKPWSLERQVRAIAGSAVLISGVLGLTVSTWFFAVTLFVGAGLTFAGLSDICLMATLLGRMPWNRLRVRKEASKAICR